MSGTCKEGFVFHQFETVEDVKILLLGLNKGVGHQRRKGNRVSHIVVGVGGLESNKTEP